MFVESVGHETTYTVASKSVTLRAEPLLSLFLSGQETEKDPLHKSALTFEVAVASTLVLVIPVYFRQTGFSSASINFWREADGRN